jgi:acyl phosphate:glycerol-3-phosphate acyltransferase
MPSLLPPPVWLLPLLLVGAYLLGGISPGWWLVRRSGGGDLRAQGSGATGATNAGRILGIQGFAFVLLLDAAKGAGAVIGVRWLTAGAPWAALALPAVVAGHIWPVWLGFRGGRGAGPILGGCIAFSWPVAVTSVIVGVVIGLIARNRFLAGASAYVISLILMLVRLPSAEQRIAYSFAWALVLLAHRNHFTKYFAS